jgi:UDP-N-acetyl-D-mannosaminuronic acid dehydrogenase
VIRASPVEAELAKLFSNAYRYITFAAANQFYLIAQKSGASFDRVRQIAREDYPRMAGFPGSGFAGGPCLFKDTMQLAGWDPASFLLGHAAMMTNEGMPAAVVKEARARHDLSRLTAGILGMAFKGDSDDPRGSLAYKLRKLLTVECKRVICTDPYVADSGFVTLDECLREADVLFVGACHPEYRDLTITKPLFDVFGYIAERRVDEFTASLSVADVLGDRSPLACELR